MQKEPTFKSDTWEGWKEERQKSFFGSLPHLYLDADIWLVDFIAMWLQSSTHLSLYAREYKNWHHLCALDSSPQ